MGLSFDDIDEDLKKIYPSIKIPKALNNSVNTEKMLQIKRGKIKTAFKNGSIDGVQKLIERCDSKIRHLERRLKKDLPHDNTTDIELSIEYFDSLIADAEKFLNDIPKESKHFESNIPNSKRGRKKDDSAPQDEIEAKVLSLIEAKKEKSSDGKLKIFVTKDGKPKPTTIRDYIESEHPELMGNIGSRALFDRVKEVTDNMK